jgi:hypothetical protein
LVAILRRLLPILLLFALFGPVRHASAYGVLGHQAIAALAEDMLTPKAKAEVKSLLGPAGGPATLASIATWADDIRMLRPETRPWHYVTIQIGEARYDSAHADSADVIKALKRQLAVLAQPGADRYAREEALKWVVHLVGDLHQPLHAGEDRDKGGNLAKVKVNRRTYNLHEVWDYVLLERLRLPPDSLRPMLERQIAADPEFIRRNAQGTVENWADDTHAKSPACYLLHGKPMRKGIKAQLDKAYVDAATVTVLTQLKIGAVRLAFALNRALDPAGSMPAPALKPPPGWRNDESAFFARAEPLKEVTGGEADSAAGDDAAAAPAAPKAAPTVLIVKAPRAARPRAAGRAKRIPGGLYAWSVNSEVYHYSECADVARIKRKNLQSGDFPPPGKILHAGCPFRR